MEEAVRNAHYKLPEGVTVHLQFEWGISAFKDQYQSTIPPCAIRAPLPIWK